jgi:hypothetical protein
MHFFMLHSVGVQRSLSLLTGIFDEKRVIKESYKSRDFFLRGSKIPLKKAISCVWCADPMQFFYHTSCFGCTGCTGSLPKVECAKKLRVVKESYKSRDNWGKKNFLPGLCASCVLIYLNLHFMLNAKSGHDPVQILCNL